MNILRGGKGNKFVNLYSSFYKSLPEFRLLKWLCITMKSDLVEMDVAKLLWLKGF